MTFVAWLVLFMIGALIHVVPASAWFAWRRRPKPRPVPLLVVAIATTTPLAIALTSSAGCLIGINAGDADPSQKARRLAESISETMNATAFAVIAAALVCVGVIVVSRLPLGRKGRD